MQEPYSVYYSAWEPQCKYPFGAIPEGTSLSLNFLVSQELRPEKVALILRREGGSQRRLYLAQSGASPKMLTFSITTPISEVGLYFYRFEIENGDGTIFVGRGENSSAIIGDFLPEWQLTVYASDFQTPQKLQQGMMYQIFPDRFLRAGDAPLPQTRNERYFHQSWEERPLFIYDVPDYQATDFFGGNLAGITQKLSYLKTLGVTMIYLNPIFEAAGNHRYNTADYLHIDPYLGTEEDFVTLCKKAEKLDIQIILDGVFSHTGSDSIYFNKEGHYPSVGAYQSAASPYASWYHFQDKERTTYDCWWGFTTLPNVNEVDPAFMEFICGNEGVLHYWMDRGASGWRLDVADELPDAFLERLRECVKAYDPDGYVLGEVWEDASNKCSYGVRRPYLLGKQLDSTMNYPWRTAIIDYMKTGNARPFYNSVMTLMDHYPAPVLACLMTPLSTHDCPRIITVLGVNHSVDAAAQGDYQITPQEYALGKELFKQAAILQFTLPGFPSLYYGDEAGLCGFADPWNRRTYPWGKEDRDLISFFQRLGQLRRRYPQNFCEPLQFVHLSDQAIGYSRSNLLTVVPRCGKPLTLAIAAERALIATGNTRVGLKELTVAPYSAAVFQTCSSLSLFQRRFFHGSSHTAHWRNARGIFKDRINARRPSSGKIHR